MTSPASSLLQADSLLLSLGGRRVVDRVSLALAPKTMRQASTPCHAASALCKAV